jgi:hypothetical protein
MADMDLVLLGSITRDPILARAQVMRHRRIPVIQFSAASIQVNLIWLPGANQLWPSD